MNAPLVRRSFAVVINAAQFLPVAELFCELLAADFSRPVVCDNLNWIIASVSFFHVHTSKIKKNPLRIGLLSVAGFNLRVTVIVARTETSGYSTDQKVAARFPRGYFLPVVDTVNNGVIK